MLIARCELPDDLDIPVDVMAAAKEPNEVYTGTRDVLFGADSWIACANVWPHVDDSFAGNLFITLTVFGDAGMHEIGDAYDMGTSSSLCAGDIFVVDPMIVHWLAPAWGSTNDNAWVGVQWEVPIAEAKQKAREIVKMLNGEWLGLIDKRYRSWRLTGRRNAKVR